MSLLVAILTASLFAVTGFPFKFYQYWFSWSPRGTVTGLMCYFLLAGGGGGFIGWIIAHLSKAAPTGNVFLNGFFYGIAGALAVRADFRSRPKNMDPDDIQDAKSLLTTSINWVTDLLDDCSHRRAEQWLRSLDSGEIILQAHRISAYIANLPAIKMTDTAKVDYYARLVPLMEILINSPSGDDRIGAQEQIIRFCALFYKGERFMKAENKSSITASVN